MYLFTNSNIIANCLFIFFNNLCFKQLLLEVLLLQPRTSLAISRITVSPFPMRKAEYFSKDFEWEDLRAQVENDPSFSYHLLPFEPTSFSLNSVATDQSHSSAADGSHAWNRFHHRHSSGKFFKVPIAFPLLIYLFLSINKICHFIYLGY